jgi:hypothetical protein
MFNLILCIQQIRQKNSNIWKEIIFFTSFKVTPLQKTVCTICVELNPRPTGNICLFCPSFTKKLFACSAKKRNDLQIQISRQIRFIFKNDLGSE